MQHLSPISVLFVGPDADTISPELIAYLRRMPHVHLTVTSDLPSDIASFKVVVSGMNSVPETMAGPLKDFVARGGGWLHLAALSEAQLPAFLGAQPQKVGPPSELRVLFQNRDHPMAERLPEAIYMDGRYHPLELTADNTETILYADWHYDHSPVLTSRAVGDGVASCTTLQDFDHPVLQKILYRLIRRMVFGTAGESTLGVGLLGYAPWAGQLHAKGVEITSGLALRFICDLDARRLEQAKSDFPGVATGSDASGLADEPGVNLVIVATPPNTHARLALQMMEAGKHVVCEKPLALRRREAEEMQAAAEDKGVHLSCHQNRRWDVDYLAIRQALADGRIGELFYIETFVGGFFHPCGYWHSHAPVSGGTSYDWGAHYLDWVVGLMPGSIASVVGTRHKRVWHDVTNADQERIQVRFDDGREAEFMHSDIAAVRKPKWYLLGTEGAIVGHWHDVTAYEVDPLLYFHEHPIPATEMQPDLTLYRHQRAGGTVPQKLAVPAREHYGFHRNLADHLINGEPLIAPLGDSIKVVTILEAAARSMDKGGTVEALDG